MQQPQEIQNFDFSVENVEKAAISVQQSQGPQAQQSVEYLQAWQSTQQSIFQACQVLKTSQVLNAHFFAALVLDHNIPQLWNSISLEDRIQIRSFIAQQIFKYGDNLLIIASLARALAHIAVYEFPKEWEGYTIYLFPENESNVTFLMLEAFFNDFENSKFITENRRQNLRSALISKVDFFLPRILSAINVPELAIKAISTFAAMTKWAPKSAIRIEFIEAIFKQFIIAGSEATQIAVVCLKNIFIKRVDSRTFFDRFKFALLESLSTIKLPTGQSITNLPIVMKFTISLFYKYMMPIEKMVIESGDEKTRQNLISIMTTMLSIREDVPSKLWMMWLDIFKRIVDQNLNIMPLKYSTTLFTPMLSLIMKNLYEMLPESVDDYGILKVEAQNCFAKLVEVNYEAVQRFLENQAPSASLSYALGCLMSVRAPKEDMSAFLQIVDVLFRACNDKIENGDEAYIIALMFGFSRSASFLSQLGHFGKFLEIVINCLQNSSDLLRNAATHALLYTAEKDPKLYFADDTKIILESLIQMSKFFITNLSDSNAKRMFQCLSILIAQINEPNKLQQLFGPVVLALQNPADEKCVRTSLYIISRLASEKALITPPPDPNAVNIPGVLAQQKPVEYYFGKYFGPLVIEPTFQLGKVYIVQPQSNIDDVELILSALASIIRCYDDFQQAQQPIQGTLALFFNRHQILPCFYTFITKLRVKFSDMNSLYENIMNSFVYPVIPLDVSKVPEDAPLAEILDMICAFEHTPTSVEWIVKVGLGYGIPRFEKDVNVAASKAIIRVFREMDTNNLRILFTEIGVQIFVTIFGALADSMHKPSSTSLIKLFYKICKLIMNGYQFPNELREFILQALAAVFQNNEEDLFGKFMEFIVNILTSKSDNNFNQFEDGVANFLIMQNKYSPGDAAAFQIYHEPLFYPFI